MRKVTTAIITPSAQYDNAVHNFCINQVVPAQYWSDSIITRIFSISSYGWLRWIGIWTPSCPCAGTRPAQFIADWKHSFVLHSEHPRHCPQQVKRCAWGSKQTPNGNIKSGQSGKARVGVVVVVVIFNVYFRLPWGVRGATSVNLAYKNRSSALTVH